ncbi:MAG TPA: selenide, water dikinase SelD [Hyphomicrobiaceae bacterium]|nr:selenide, water dikinase SelD [Hyphomicrobiaceae bacterium]
MRVTPILKDLVLIGGGHAHVHVLKSFGMKPIPGVRVTLLSRDIETPYSGMLPGFIAGHYTKAECHIDLRPLARFAGARLIAGGAIGIDRSARRIRVQDRPDIAFDVLSIDIGSTPTYDGIAGARQHATPVKPIDGLARHWRRVLEIAEAAPRPLQFLTVGGGAAGVELTLAAQHRLKSLPKAQVRDHAFTLLTRGELLASHNARVRTAFRRELRNRNVALHEHCAVAEVGRNGLTTEDGRAFAFDELLWVTDAGAAPWLRETGLAIDGHGFISVDACLQSTNTPGVFAAGDIASSTVHPRPKAGVFAVRQGPPLQENLRRALAGSELQPFKPQTNFLSLISTGDKVAVASRGALALSGPRLWTLKDWIDRRWMDGYQSLRPGMGGETAKAAGDDIGAAALASLRCGGCGAKVGANALSRALARLAPKASAGAVIALGEADDAAVIAPPPGMHLVQTVDFFRAFIDDPYLFGRIAAVHALGDVYAMGGAPLTALATAVIPYAAEAMVEDDLYQMLRGALDVLEPAGCALVGGHSAEGAELALGFAINGAVDPSRILRKGGVRPGDALILTKPLGTGALFAAEMRGAAEAGWIAAALKVMQQSNAKAAKIAIDAGATACTDVTGFGLAGHLLEMLGASRCDATIDLGKLPVLAGALDVIGRGIESSIAPENVRVERAIESRPGVGSGPRYRILFDPQTAGGLLFAMPASEAEGCIRSLMAASYCDAAIIGIAREPSGLEPKVLLQEIENPKTSFSQSKDGAVLVAG